MAAVVLDTDGTSRVIPHWGMASGHALADVDAPERPRSADGPRQSQEACRGS